MSDANLVDRFLEATKRTEPFLHCLEKIWSPLLADKAEPSLVLYHYTTAYAHLEIISGCTLWFTDVRYLNDAQEVVYGVTLMKDVVDNTLRATEELPVTAFCEMCSTACRFEKNIATEFLNERALVACFTEKDDDLYQWRAYGGQTSGFAIGFEAATLCEQLAEGMLQRVEYSSNKQKEVFTGIFDRSIDAFRQSWECYKNDRNYDLIKQNITIWLERYISILALKFKHVSFESEMEWRLIQQRSSQNDTDVEFRNGKIGLIPFVKMKAEEGHFPIARIVIWPRVNDEVSALEVRAVEDLLRKYGYKKPYIMKSTIPIRY